MKVVEHCNIAASVEGVDVVTKCKAESRVAAHIYTLFPPILALPYYKMTVSDIRTTSASAS